MSPRAFAFTLLVGALATAGGVRAGRISLVTYGEERPLCTERTEACWARNRRAHFLVKPE